MILGGQSNFTLNEVFHSSEPTYFLAWFPKVLQVLSFLMECLASQCQSVTHRSGGLEIYVYCPKPSTHQLHPCIGLFEINSFLKCSAVASCGSYAFCWPQSKMIRFAFSAIYIIELDPWSWSILLQLDQFKQAARYTHDQNLSARCLLQVADCDNLLEAISKPTSTNQYLKRMDGLWFLWCHGSCQVYFLD